MGALIAVGIILVGVASIIGLIFGLMEYIDAFSSAKEEANRPSGDNRHSYSAVRKYDNPYHFPFNYVYNHRWHKWANLHDNPQPDREERRQIRNRQKFLDKAEPVSKLSK